jgi:adenylate kinase family enzyme
MPDLIVIYGPPLSGKSTVARELGRAMAEKSAIVSTDYLLSEAIARPDRDREAELELVHQQLRLMVANYLKFRYHCIVEGPFIFENVNALMSYEAHIDQLLALMRMMTLRKMIVRLSASEEELGKRAEQSGREEELALALRVNAAYRPRIAPELLSFNTDAHSPAEIVASILEELPGMPRGQG